MATTIITPSEERTTRELSASDTKRLQHFRELFTKEQLEDADARWMGSSIGLLKQYAEEMKECAPNGIIDQRIAEIDAKNASLPEQERDKRAARLARQKSDALGAAVDGGEID